MRVAVLVATAVALGAADAPAVPSGEAVPGGIYRVTTTQGADAGEIRIARTRPRMLDGSAIGVEWQCRRGGNLIEEAILDGATIAPSGTFSWIDRKTYLGGGVASVIHVEGRFLTRRLARGTVWGYAGGRKTPCRVSEARPVRFRAVYVGQTPR